VTQVPSEKHFPSLTNSFDLQLWPKTTFKPPFTLPFSFL
jgi:hypothetical protein